MDVALNQLGVVCALGSDVDTVRQRLLSGSTLGMDLTEEFSPGRPLTVGKVSAELPEVRLLQRHFQSRNNRLLLAALAPIRSHVDAAIQRYGRQRVAVVLGTSTSGIQEAERAFDAAAGALGALPAWFDYKQMEISGPSEFLASELDVSGPALTISTACSSSAKALLSARRLLRLGLCDAAVVGGADTLSRFTVAGFNALGAYSSERCNPLSKNRAGINIGEAAALFLMTAEPGPVRLIGGGESSDAHHVSAPDPEARGASRALAAALADARLEPSQIDYLNLHGTATEQNDAMESRAVHALLGSELKVSSTKPLSGHTLGAAGALEAAFCWMLLGVGNAERRLPPHVFDGEYDPALPTLNLVRAGQQASRLERVMSNSFGFFGSNAVLVLEASR